MPVQRTLVLVVLAALFTMHGLQSLGMPQAPTHAVGIAPQAATVEGETVTDSVGATWLQPVADSRPTLAATQDAMPGSGPGHGVAQHLWSLCLAVLLAGLSFLGALAAVRRLSATSGPAPGRRPRRVLACVGRLRPPDLASLCLLRI